MTVWAVCTVRRHSLLILPIANRSPSALDPDPQTGAPDFGPKPILAVASL